jgi:carbamoyltransferase
MIVLGIFAFGMNPGACLLRDGELIAFGEEERFSRLKGSHGMFPGRAITACLGQAGIELDEVDHIAFAWDANKYPYRMLRVIARQYLKYRGKSTSSGAGVGARGKSKAAGGANLITVLSKLLKYSPKRLLEEIRFSLRATGYRGELPPIEFVPHHLCHAYSAYFSSPFEDALVVTVDGSGEDICTQVAVGEGSSLRVVKSTAIPHSLGWYYAAFTAYMGFIPYRHEGKLMALAGLGHERAADNPWPERLSEILSVSNGDYQVDPTYTRFGAHSHAERFTDKLPDFITGFDPKLKPLGFRDGKATARLLDPDYIDLAWGVQHQLEEAVAEVVRGSAHETQSRNLCIAGGVGQNCKMNGSLLASAGVDRMFGFPACHDAGSAIGAAMYVAQEGGDTIQRELRSAQLGPEFSNDEIRDILEFSKVSFTAHDDIAARTAGLLVEGKLIGWFQGRMEMGPRALGGRSILADPRAAGVSERLNREVKSREAWRPFCPSILASHADEHFERARDASFMTVALDVRESAREGLVEAMHVDGSARPQVVHEDAAPIYHRLLEEFESRSGTPFVVNTSFNVSGEPIVCSPAEALRSFYACGLDALAIGDFLIEKT